MKKHKQSGQALVEFLVAMPLLLSFVWYMLHVNMAINKSIVAQKSVRSWLFNRMMNHSDGPQTNPDTLAQDRSAYFLAVSKDPVPSGSDVFDAREAPVEILGVGFSPKRAAGANDDPGEQDLGTIRQGVRIRSAYGICTSRKVLALANKRTNFCDALPAGTNN